MTPVTTSPRKRGRPPKMPDTPEDIDAQAIAWLWQRGILSDTEAADIGKRVLQMVAKVERQMKRGQAPNPPKEIQP